MVTILKASYMPYLYKIMPPPINTYSYNFKNLFLFRKLKNYNCKAKLLF